MGLKIATTFVKLDNLKRLFKRKKKEKKKKEYHLSIPKFQIQRNKMGKEKKRLISKIIQKWI